MTAAALRAFNTYISPSAFPDLVGRRGVLFLLRWARTARLARRLWVRCSALPHQDAELALQPCCPRCNCANHCRAEATARTFTPLDLRPHTLLSPPQSECSLVASRRWPYRQGTFRELPCSSRPHPNQRGCRRIAVSNLQSCTGTPTVVSLAGGTTG